MILIDGKPADSIPVMDSVVLRGDGVFEALRTFDGRPFALSEHVARLTTSALALELDPPPLDLIAEWVGRAALPVGPGTIRILVTRGDATVDRRIVVIGMPVPTVPHPFTVVPHPAPWHPAGRPWELAGVKTVSYAPNLAASRRAHAQGYEDALLISDQGVILEGPTFCVGWFRQGRFETPSLDLGILASITRAQTIEAARHCGFEIVEGRFQLDSLGEVTDLVAMSTVKQVTSVVRCGALEPEVTAATKRLQAEFASYLADRLSQDRV